ncbi:MAG: M23 family metallopeptidase, partial [Rhodospirillales bacterium]|nr:M23 family metallopeptidase [Rhodospirillales bacterium]
WDVDFQRDIWPGDSFEVMWQRVYDDSGNLVHNGEILYANLNLTGTSHPIYRFEVEDGHFDYFNEEGQSARKALMRTPIDGARLSSRYGKRKHPILGFTKMHRGVDFAAPKGTPIYAAGDGRVEASGWNGTYGKYVRIRHNSEYSTAYAHMSRIARSAGKGKRVRQGQVIGYVGNTGRSTGAHLHYEILRGGRQTNPLKVRMPSGRKLKGEMLAKFQKVRAGLDTVFANLTDETELADNRD